MLIVLDYDDTYTRDPAFWDAFILSTVSTAHRIICCTMRYPRETITDLDIPIYYSSRAQKRAYLAALDIFPDVWIDDTPEFIGEIYEFEWLDYLR